MDSSRATDIATGTTVGGRYTVHSLIGRGGMASVYRATDGALGRNVALKIFTADTEGAGLGRESSEIQLLASLNHHALVTLFDANVDGGDGADHSFLVMELVEGPTLRQRIDTARIAEIDVARLLVDLAEALSVVHSNGVVHRDVKPANILLSPSVSRSIEFRAKLSDFGIAYLIDSTRLTMPGTIIGTAAYLSPEQARGDSPGPASDIYSLGLVVLEALTGARVFEGSMVESLSARLMADPPIPATLGSAWVSLLTRMTAREPEARPAALEVAELASAIERELYAASTGETEDLTAVDAASDLTQSLDEPAQPLGELTQPLGEPTQSSDVPTRSMDAPTRVMPSASVDDEATAVLPSAAPGAPSTPSATPKSALTRRIVLAGAAAVVAIGIGAFVWSATTSGGETPATPVPTLPANEGALGTHLDELLKSVTP